MTEPLEPTGYPRVGGLLRDAELDFQTTVDRPPARVGMSPEAFHLVVHELRGDRVDEPEKRLTGALILWGWEQIQRRWAKGEERPDIKVASFDLELVSLLRHIARDHQGHSEAC